MTQVLNRVRSIFHLRRQTLRVQLTLLYAGLGIGLCAGVLGAAGVLVGHSSQSAPILTPRAIVRSHPSTDVHNFSIGAAVIFVVAAALALALSWWLAGRLLQPLRTITATAQEISASSLHERLHLEGADDELRQLGKTLDDLFGRLEASFESQRHFVANASHELRTPLTGQRTLLQVALADPDVDVDKLRATCEEALRLGEQQERLIDALLTLATSERGLDERSTFDLTEIAASVTGARQEEALFRGLRLEATLAGAQAVGDSRLIESLVANLVDNALRHNIPDGDIAISTRTVGGRAALSISNTGPVIRPEDIDRLFQPFQQVSAERVRQGAGHGLGLTIVRAISDAHGATITARPGSGGGLDIEVLFP
jgi:signal transduction histidine kinase